MPAPYETNLLIPDYELAVPQEDFTLDCTLCCGQAFRWSKTGSLWQGSAGGRQLSVAQEGNRLLFYGTSPQEVEDFWMDYFDLNTDYAALKKQLCAHPVMEKACAFSPGMRLLRQQPWEALCTFILSQNNNIPRIRGLVQRLCDCFGNPVSGGLPDFPTPERLATLSTEDLAPIRAGFRSAYLLDAAKKIASGEIQLDQIRTMDTETARQELMKIKGVGPKVADCTLLFGFYKLDSFPQDVWIKRVVAALFPNGLPSELLPIAGVAQQYLFHYARCNPEIFTQTA